MLLSSWHLGGGGRRTDVWGSSSLHSKFRAVLGSVRSCLKMRKKKGKEKPNTEILNNDKFAFSLAQKAEGATVQGPNGLREADRASEQARDREMGGVRCL